MNELRVKYRSNLQGKSSIHKQMNSPQGKGANMFKKKLWVWGLMGVALVAASLVLLLSRPQETALAGEDTTDPMLVVEGTPDEPQPDPENVSDETIQSYIDEIQALAELWMGSTVKAPGWFYNYAKVERPLEEPSELRNGQILPANYTTEVWGFLEEDGTISRKVSIQRDLDGNTTQVSTYQDGRWLNSATGETRGGKPSVFSQSHPGVDIELARAAENGMPVWREEVVLDGVPVVRFYKDYTNNEVITLPGGEQKTSTTWRVVYTFNMETGAYLSVEECYIFEGESECQLSMRLSGHIFEMINQPPLEVLDYLKGDPK